MKPSQANKQDWRMYYADTWMNHVKYGPGHIYVRDGQLTHTRGGRNDPTRDVEPDDLECWWPRSGSYNTPRGAVYIARKAARNMRKSASYGDHYQLTYGRGDGGDVLRLMIDGPDYLSVKEARAALRRNITASVAVTRDIILAMQDEHIVVVFRGIHTGVLTDNGFEAYIADDPLSKRAYVKLMAEGIV